MDKKELMAELETLKTGLVEAATKEAKAEIEKQIKEVNYKLAAIEDVKADIKVIKDAAEKNQKAIDDMISANNKKTVKAETKTFGEALNEQVKEAFDAGEFNRFKNDRNAKLTLDLKAVGNMTISNLTGDPVASYNSRQGLVPAHKTNFRDLIPTTSSPTGLYVTYRETGGEGGIAAQTEGSAKSQIDYDLTEVKVVSDYIAGFARFSKQMAYQLPFLQGTLPRMLMRDFYKKENDIFFTAVSGAATGSATMTATVDAEQILELIGNQMNASFNPSYILVNPAEWVRLLLTKPADYSVPGGVAVDANGSIRIAGVPVVAVPWVTDDKVLIIDTDFLERVETESVRVEFAYEDSDNFQKNLITARVECFEDINLLRTDAHIYADMGNVA